MRMDRITDALDSNTPTIFLDGPAEFLVKTLAQEIGKVKQFKMLFGDSIDPYEREDYGMRELPALRIYNEDFTKDSESWFINGDVKLDCLLPASLRRNELQQVSDTLSSALVQQFRRPEWFQSLLGLIPGLNELGKVFSVNKALQFSWEENIVPLTQITVNFKLDLRAWDDYLEQESRTKDEPFERTLGKLEKIATVIRGLNDGGSTQVEVDTTTDLTREE